MPPLKSYGTEQHKHPVNTRQHIHSKLIQKSWRIKHSTVFCCLASTQSIHLDCFNDYNDSADYLS